MKAMRIFNLVVIILLVMAFLPAQQMAQARPAAQDIPADALYVPGEVVVTFIDGLPAASYTAQATALAGSISAAVVRQDKNTALLSFSPDADVTALVNQIAAVSVVKTAQPNYIHRIPEKDGQLQGKKYTPAAFQTTAANGSSIKLSWSELLSLRTLQGNPAYPNESSSAWGWFKVGADIIWGMTASTAQVCLLDSGVDSAHPDLTGSISTGYDFVNNDSLANDDNGHGTHLAGIILAKGNNGAGTAIGVTRAKIVPVKVANAQGWGTSFNIAAGIRYCAGLSAVKVINLSMGGPTPDPLEYTALKTAVIKKKLIVVAAGNDSKSYVGTSEPLPASFPGGWANLKVNVFDTTGTLLNIPNDIYTNLITVGAARDPSLNTWVDTVPDPDTLDWRTIQPEELLKDCATEFTNYGDWVTMVAPGSNIYSTTPKSYPFYMNFYNDVPALYGTMSGTSQAAAFVSAAAARVWGTWPTLTALQVKNRLHDSGRLLTPATDRDDNASFLAGFDNNLGFANPNDNSDPAAYGVPYNPLEPYNDPDTIMAPFCWPQTEISGTFSSDPDPDSGLVLQDMSATRYLNVAAAMARVAFWATVHNGTSGMPMTGAQVKVTRGTTGTTQVGLTTIPAGLTRSQPDVALLNLPVTTATTSPFNPLDTTFKLWVSKTSYTNGFQKFNQILVNVGAGPDWSQLGKYYTDPYNRVSLMPSTNFQAVVDWTQPDPEDADPQNLDAFLFLPENVNDDNGATIGPPDSNDDPHDLHLPSFFGGGTLLLPSKFGGTFSPYAQYQFNGGVQTGTDASGNPVYSDPLEAITISSSATRTTTPFLVPKYNTLGTYTFFVYADDSANLAASTPLKPVVRLWARGILVNAYTLSDSSCDGSKDWWQVFTIHNITVSAPSASLCGISPTVWPYSTP